MQTDLKAIIARLDKDKDGKISFKEFAHGIQLNPVPEPLHYQKMKEEEERAQYAPVEVKPNKLGSS